MTAFLLQVWTILQEGYVQIYFLFFIIVNAFFWLRVYLARKNKTYTEVYTGKLAVIVPVFRESREVFEQCLSSIKKYGKPAQLIVTIDDAGHASDDVKKVAHKYADQVIEMKSRVGKREQFFIASQKIKKNIDIVITVDSDTYWDDSTMEIVKPFRNEKVGAVSGRQTIFDYKRTAVRRIAEWMEDLRFRIVLPFQSYFGQVNVIPGRTLAIRSRLFQEIAQDIRDERVLGRSVVTSDDASITMGVLERGYKSVYQHSSLVHTDAPDTAWRFWKQYLRWYRGSMRRFFYKFPTLIKQHPLVFLSNFEFIFGTFIYTSIVLTFIFKIHFRLFEVMPVSGFEFSESFNLGFICLLFAGYLVSSYLRNLPHLIHNKSDFIFLPIFSLFTLIVMLPLKLVSAFSFFENGWMTRKHHSEESKEQHVKRTRIVAATTGLVITLAALPLPYLIDITRIGVPFMTIVRNEAPEYARAAEIIAANESGEKVTQNQINHVVERYALHHNESSNTETASRCISYRLEQGIINDKDPLELVAGCSENAGRYLAQRDDRDAQDKASSTQKIGLIGFVVTEGDSFTHIVRKAVRTLDTEHTLTNTQAVFIESTYINSHPQFDRPLAEGETVSIDLGVLSSILDRSKLLSEDEQSAWAIYASQIRY
jgi:cellulose synthase/poly-beta-1,6-N-acetylglucosamine synthase-like glycosyltransferase